MPSKLNKSFYEKAINDFKKLLLKEGFRNPHGNSAFNIFEKEFNGVGYLAITIPIEFDFRKTKLVSVFFQLHNCKNTRKAEDAGFSKAMKNNFHDHLSENVLIDLLNHYRSIIGELNGET